MSLELNGISFPLFDNLKEACEDAQLELIQPLTLKKSIKEISWGIKFVITPTTDGMLFVGLNLVSDVESGDNWCLTMTDFAECCSSSLVYSSRLDLVFRKLFKLKSSICIWFQLQPMLFRYDFSLCLTGSNVKRFLCGTEPLALDLGLPTMYTTFKKFDFQEVDFNNCLIGCHPTALLDDGKKVYHSSCLVDVLFFRIPRDSDFPDTITISFDCDGDCYPSETYVLSRGRWFNLCPLFSMVIVPNVDQSAIHKKWEAAELLTSLFSHSQMLGRRIQYRSFHIDNRIEESYHRLSIYALDYHVNRVSD